MSVLRQVKGQRKRREFLTYDFEWIPGKLEIRMCGVFDGKEFRYYRTVADFVNGEFTRESRHKWFFAHSGGRADLIFLLEQISKDSRWSVEASMSGSSAIIATIRRHGNSYLCQQDDHSGCPTWTFVDSFWLFRTSLKKIGEKLGIEKGGPDMDEEDDDAKIKEWYATVPFSELRDYNEVDCRILWHGINQFQDLLWSMGSQLKKTIASCAMELFRRKYLKSEIRIVDNINQYAQDSYAASRVEVYQKQAHDGYSFDLNSSFAYAMTFPTPGNAIRMRNGKIPDHNLYIARACVQVPDSYLPPLAYRRKSRLFFPVGKWDGWFTGVDLQLLEESGGQIIKIYESIEFESRDDLRDYVEDIYERRRVATTDFEKMVFKYLLNALYGKFGESEEKCRLFMNPEQSVLNDLRQREAEGLEMMSAGETLEVTPPEMIFPGAWIDYKLAKLSHNHNPLATHITSVARRTIYRYLIQPIQQPGGEIHYCDTDGLSTNLKLWEDSDKLGELKLVRSFQDAEYLAPKVYRQDDNVYAKGFQLGKTKKTKLQRFRELVENQEIEIERMARFKEMLRARTWKPFDVTTRKALRGKAMGKRKMFPNGKTRPWTVKELESSRCEF